MVQSAKLNNQNSQSYSWSNMKNLRKSWQKTFSGLPSWKHTNPDQKTTPSRIVQSAKLNNELSKS